jgi:hypothetical protein
MNFKPSVFSLKSLGTFSLATVLLLTALGSISLAAKERLLGQTRISFGTDFDYLAIANDCDRPSVSAMKNKRPRRKQRGIVTLFLTFHAPQGAGNLPVILLKSSRLLPKLIQFLSDTATIKRSNCLYGKILLKIVNPNGSIYTSNVHNLGFVKALKS